MVLRCIEVSGCESVEAFSMTLRGYLFLPRKVVNTSVAPMPGSLTIRIESNDFEVLYAPRSSANPSASPMPTSRRQGGEQ